MIFTEDHLARAAGSRVSSWRIAADLSLEQAAKKIGVSTSWLSMLERGERSPSLNVMIRIYEATGILPSQLIEVSYLSNENDPKKRLVDAMSYLGVVEECIQEVYKNV